MTAGIRVADGLLDGGACSVDGAPRSRGGWRQHRLLGGVLLLALCLNLYGIGWGLPNRVDWAIDSIAPTEPLRYAKMLVAGEAWSNKYPAFHYAVISAVSAPYVAFLFATDRAQIGVNADDAFAPDHAETALSGLTLTARVVSALMGAGLAAIAYAVTATLFGRRAAIFSALIVCLSPLVIYYAHNANVDVPYLFWSGLAIWALVRVMQAPRTRYYVVLGIGAALAVATKDQAYGLVLVLPVVLVWLRRRTGAAFGEVLDRPLILGGVAAVMTYAVASNLLFNFSGWIEHLRHITGPGSVPYRVFDASPRGYVGLAVATAANVVTSLNPALFVVCLAGVAHCLWRRPLSTVPLLLGLSYFVSFLMVILFVFPRFVLPFVFLLAPYGGRVLARMWDHQWPSRLAVGAILAYSLAYAVSLDLEFVNDARYAAENWIRGRIPAHALVGTNARQNYLPRFPESLAVVSVEPGRDGLGPVPRKPDFLVLSDGRYRTRAARQRDLEALVDGLGYRQVAEFTSRWFLGPRFIPGLSPDIVILAADGWREREAP
jgi:4-amino-4-deoxy-L-arabinose transferase-like glycosyltransferase